MFNLVDSSPITLPSKTIHNPLELASVTNKFQLSSAYGLTANILLSWQSLEFPTSPNSLIIEGGKPFVHLSFPNDMESDNMNNILTNLFLGIEKTGQHLPPFFQGDGLSPDTLCLGFVNEDIANFACACLGFSKFDLRSGSRREQLRKNLIAATKSTKRFCTHGDAPNPIDSRYLILSTVGTFQQASAKLLDITKNSRAYNS